MSDTKLCSTNNCKDNKFKTIIVKCEFIVCNKYKSDCDDDTYANFGKLISLLEELDIDFSITHNYDARIIE
jgi:hypothetical protein